MEDTKHTLAIVLNRQSYRDYDSLVVVYTEKFGKLILIARGTKKPQSKLAGHLEPLSLVDLMIVPGKGRDYVGSILAQNARLNLKQDLNKLYYAGQAVNCFNRLIKEKQTDPGLFLLLNDWLNNLNDYSSDFSREQGELFLNYFNLKLLIELGYQPEMYHCLLCQQKIQSGRNYFDLQNGGLICEKCHQATLTRPEILAVSDDIVKLVRFLSANSWEEVRKLKIDKKISKELTTLVINFINFNN